MLKLSTSLNSATKKRKSVKTQIPNASSETKNYLVLGAAICCGGGLGCFSASTGSRHFRGRRLKKGQSGMVIRVVMITPEAYVSSIVLNEPEA